MQFNSSYEGLEKFSVSFPSPYAANADTEEANVITEATPHTTTFLKILFFFVTALPLLIVLHIYRIFYIWDSHLASVYIIYFYFTFVNVEAKIKIISNYIYKFMKKCLISPQIYMRILTIYEALAK